MATMPRNFHGVHHLYKQSSHIRPVLIASICVVKGSLSQVDRLRMTESSTTSGLPVVVPNGSSSSAGVLQDAFRQKTLEMKHWVPLPDSMPSVCIYCVYT